MNSPKAQLKLAALEKAKCRWQRVRSLVEKVGFEASVRGPLIREIRRASEDARRVFMANGLWVLAHGANQMVVLLKREGSVHTEVRKMLELVRIVATEIDRAEKEANEAGHMSPDDTGFINTSGGDRSSEHLLRHQ